MDRQSVSKRIRKPRMTGLPSPQWQGDPKKHPPVRVLPAWHPTDWLAKSLCELSQEAG
jgi:hypothetical protein